MLEIDAVGMYDTAAEEQGKVFVTTELGGGGTATARTTRIARRGVMNVLRHAGIVAGAVESQPTQWLDMPSVDCFSFAEDEGLYEAMIDLGDPIEKGDIIARVHATTRTGQPPQDIRAKLSGVLAARHFPGLIRPGDCASRGGGAGRLKTGPNAGVKESPRRPARDD